MQSIIVSETIANNHRPFRHDNNPRNKTSQFSVRYKTSLDGNVQIFDLTKCELAPSETNYVSSLDIYLQITFVTSFQSC